MSELSDIIRPGAGRGLDFVILDDLRKRTGITKPEIVKFAMSEMLANSLDTDATEIWIQVSKKDEFDEVTVTDNGSTKITRESLELILDFGSKASSKRGFFMVSRGYLGNALKCLFGYSHALAIEKRLSIPEIVVVSHGTKYRIKLKPDKVKEIINSEIVAEKFDELNINSFSLKYPYDHSAILGRLENPNEATEEDLLAVERELLYKIIFGTSMVNATRKIHCNLWGERSELGEAVEAFIPRKETSVIWYEKDQFIALFKDFVRATPETHLTDFVALFRGFTGRVKKKEILAKIVPPDQHSSGEFCEFLPTTPIRALNDDDIERLYLTMLVTAKKINVRSINKVLGVVGKDQFEKVRERMGWRKLKYSYHRSRSSDWESVSYPFIIEFALFEREEEDQRGVNVYQCVNFMASMEDIFSRLYDVKTHLARCGVTSEMPITVVVHLICPVLKWLDYGKGGLYE